MNGRAPRTQEELFERITAAGGRIMIRRNGHLTVTAPNGNRVFMSRTPSDYRAVHKQWRDWKRALG